MPNARELELADRLDLLATGGGGPHASSHEAGGDDPITNAQVPFTFDDDGDGSVTVTDDPGQAGSPVLTVDGVPVNADKIVLRALGAAVELYDNTPEVVGVFNVAVLAMGNDLDPLDPDGSGHAQVLISNAFGGPFLKIQSLGLDEGLVLTGDRAVLYPTGLVITKAGEPKHTLDADSGVALYGANGLAPGARPALTTAVVADDVVANYNALRTALIALGVATDGDP